MRNLRYYQPLECGCHAPSSGDNLKRHSDRLQLRGTGEPFRPINSELKMNG
ncbi:UNVERIFIED_CONTAM: hypothetical protein NCL1_08236 [Trichonephila clavipes]